MSTSCSKLKTGVKLKHGMGKTDCVKELCDRAVRERVLCECSVCDKERLCVTMLYVKESCVKGSV